MNWKEIFASAVAVAVGVLLANIISKKVPALSSYDDSFDSETD